MSDLVAGPATDRAVAEALGWVEQSPGCWSPHEATIGITQDVCLPLSAYSTDWGAAMRAAEACGLLKAGSLSQMAADGHWKYDYLWVYEQPHLPTIFAPTGPLCICAAILARRV